MDSNSNAMMRLSFVLTSVLFYVSKQISCSINDIDIDDEVRRDVNEISEQSEVDSEQNEESEEENKENEESEEENKESEEENKFFQACVTGKADKLATLVLNGASIPVDFDAPIDDSNTSPLQILVEKVSLYAGKDSKRTDTLVSIIKALVKHGADLERVNDSGWTALNQAVFLASVNQAYPLDVIASLLPENRKCPAINFATHSRTPLHFAAASSVSDGRARDIVKLLTDRCASLIKFDIRDSKGWTALKTALIHENNDAKAIIASKAPYLTFFQLLIVLFGGVAVLVVSAVFYFQSRKSPKEKDDDGEDEIKEEAEIKEEDEIKESDGFVGVPESKTSLTARTIPATTKINEKI